MAEAAQKPEIRIGISGWTYPPWRKTFFPEGLRQQDELRYASGKVSSIEINGTFYSLQRPTSYAKWYGETPASFVFSVKAPRFITHIKRLRNIEKPLANFFASGVLRLNEKLGPFLWQLPPSLPYDKAVLEAFFKLLPRTTDAAVRLARRHDDHVRLGTWMKTDKNRPLRHSLEVRHETFKKPEFIELLRKHDIALVVADTAGKWPALEDVTSDFIYVRLHGDSKLYVSGYTPKALDYWAGRIRAWSKGRSLGTPKRIGKAPTRAAKRDVYVYFDNDVKTRAPFDAMSLSHRLGLEERPENGPAESEVVEEARTDWPWIRPRKAPVPAKKRRAA
ncbi:MAG TPA: DUF72 domain-containing protein [Opitutaceae bacterium]|jgi:uncharacterized protein YecE (DUF72 family)|nr:DUF72 domain-containing protein [Opitutaceae bacterium]